jgi:hypothetical protein
VTSLIALAHFERRPYRLFLGKQEAGLLPILSFWFLVYFSWFLVFLPYTIVS